MIGETFESESVLVNGAVVNVRGKVSLNLIQKVKGQMEVLEVKGRSQESKFVNFFIQKYSLELSIAVINVIGS